jgi:hypothetical protein
MINIIVMFLGVGLGSVTREHEELMTWDDSSSRARSSVRGQWRRVKEWEWGWDWREETWTLVSSARSECIAIICCWLIFG